jgi:hypothetical protein
MISSLEELEKLFELCQRSGVTHLKVDSVEFKMQSKLPDMKPLTDQVTDEQILHNPYAGME